MDKGWIGISCWISIAIISAIVFWIGGANLGNYIFVGLLIVAALITTLGVIVLAGAMEQDIEKARTKPEFALLNELSKIRLKMEELTKEVEEIKKAIEE